jgi:hypothetical protein
MERNAIGMKPVRKAKGNERVLLLLVALIGVSIDKKGGTGIGNFPALLFRLMLMMNRSGLF